MITLYNMDVMKALKQMPDESVDMQITSPPYWGLRDYGEGVEVIWDGDEDCEHEFNIQKRKLHSGSTKEEWVGDMSRGIRNIAGEWETKDGFCSKCGAWKGQLGLEPDFNLFIKHLCDVFDEVKRVLKKDGTCWVNLGDTYSGSGQGSQTGYGDKKREKVIGSMSKSITINTSISAKCLCAIPERFIIEMISRGWILRNKIIWHKPNHMPTSVKDRFANSWEYLFMFSKNKKYYFDLDAMREPHQTKENRPMGIVRERTMKYKSKRNLNPEAFNSPRARLDRESYSEKQFYNPKGKNPDDVIEHKQDLIPTKNIRVYKGFNARYIPNPKGTNPDDVISTSHFLDKEYIDSTSLKGQAHANKFAIKKAQNRAMGIKETDLYNPLGKNPSDFWDITTHGYPEAHFAVFPEKLVERPIKTTPKWICNKCGKARERITEPTEEYKKLLGESWHNHKDDLGLGQRKEDTKGHRATAEYITKGWTNCNCKAGFHPAVILDIFAGSGTTLKVARRLGRDAIGIEIKSEYVKLIKKRLFRGHKPLFPDEFKVIK